MKKILLITILLSLLLSFGIQVFAQDTELPSPGLLPDNVFYFLKTWKEQIQLFFTFDAEKKAEQYLHLADVRLAEYQKMIEKGKEEIAQRVLVKYEKQLGHALSKAKELQNKGKDNQGLFQKIEDTTVKHISVLEKNMENVSANAKKGFEEALESSKKVAQEKAVQNFEVFEAKCREAGGPPEVCVEFKVNLQSSKSLRTFCIEKGGSSEQCEQFPAQDFESFEQIKAYCMEDWGAPPELCASLETKCRELGITSPDECFLVLSIATVSASPAPSLSEEEMEERRQREEESRRDEEEENIRIEYQNAYLGVMFSTINDNMQVERELPVNYGALIMSIVPDSPAALAGLKNGDIILEFHGERITEDNNLTEVISRSNVGVALNLKILRGEGELIINLELIEKPAD